MLRSQARYLLEFAVGAGSGGKSGVQREAVSNATHPKKRRQSGAVDEFLRHNARIGVDGSHRRSKWNLPGNSENEGT
jgi:hypothetical protein